MKRSTIWIIAIVMGGSFITLLYLQARYFEEVIDMRREQFDESVGRALYRAAHNLELNETRRNIETEIYSTDRNYSRKHQTNRNTDSLAKSIIVPNITYNIPRSKSVEDAKYAGGVQQKKSAAERRADVLRLKVKRRYTYQQKLINEAIYDILYEPSSLPLAERLDFNLLDRNLRAELRNVGINLNYHFTVNAVGGREVYRCADYTNPGESVLYKQELFPNDPPMQMGTITVFFPDMGRYLFTSVRFMIPAIIFTFVLLLIFIFTIVTIFRQKRLSDIKNDFINNMTHEFKTPISTISLASQMLSDTSVPKSEKMLAHLSGVIADETKRLRFQVEKVLQMSMFDKSKAPTFKEQKIIANNVIADVCSTFQLKATQAGGSVTTHLEAEDSEIFADEMHFTNVIFNLLDNALKYKSPDRPITLNVSTEEVGKHLRISIADNGIGIRREDLKKIFDKFYRVSTGNRHDVKGFGLGLAYVKNVIRAHKGTIHAESHYGEGTTFIIMLPLLNAKNKH